MSSDRARLVSKWGSEANRVVNGNRVGGERECVHSSFPMILVV